MRPKVQDPWDNDSSDDIIIEGENDVWGVPFDSKTQAICEPGDDREVPTSEKMTMRDYSAAELVGLASSFKQKGKRGGCLGVTTAGSWGR